MRNWLLSESPGFKKKELISKQLQDKIAALHAKVMDQNQNIANWN